MLGDGRLNYYGPEITGELYYSAKLHQKGLWLSADYQLCLNPGYNKDRGPAGIASIRVHVELRRPRRFSQMAQISRNAVDATLEKNLRSSAKSAGKNGKRTQQARLSCGMKNTRGL